MGRKSVEELLKETKFNRQELETLTKNFNLLDPTSEKGVDRFHFRDLLSDVFGIDDSLLTDRVFKCFDMDTDNYVGYDEFIKQMSIFLKGSLEEKTKFCFKVYDLNNDHYIQKDEMFQMLKSSLVKETEEDEDGVKELVELAIKRLDEDKDGKVSESDFSTSIVKQNLLLEAFGQCLPDPKVAAAYLNPDIVIIPGLAGPRFLDGNDNDSASDTDSDNFAE